MSLHLALEVDEADVPSALATVTTAEQAGFALVTLADGPGRPEPGVWASFLSRRTDRIGLAPVLHATTTEPFHLATQLASLDHASLGRAAWLVGAANTAPALATVGRTPLPENALRQELADVIEAARRLWDSWEDDAIIKDVPTGRFLDRHRVHHIDFEGATFSITGPLITPRPPQGQVVVIAPDTLGVTDRLDIALIPNASPPETRRRADRARRDGAALVFAELTDPTAEQVNALDGIVDGVLLRAALPYLIERILPGVDHSVPAAGATLRETLGLPRPANRYATAR